MWKQSDYIFQPVNYISMTEERKCQIIFLSWFLYLLFISISSQTAKVSSTMSNFGQKNKFCALFLESHWFRFKMCHQCQNQGQTGLEATGGPRGASQPLQSIKIYKNQTWSEIDPTKTPPAGLGFLALSSTQSSLPFSRANWFRGH